MKNSTTTCLENVNQQSQKSGKSLVALTTLALLSMTSLSSSALANNPFADFQFTQGAGTKDLSVNNQTSIDLSTKNASGVGNIDILKDQILNVNGISGGRFVAKDNRANDVSTIAGTLNSNIDIVLIDTNGIIFTDSSVINVNSIIASTAENIVFSDRGDFERAEFSNLGDGNIEFNGVINVADAGLAAFVAPHIINNGIINAKLGNVAFAAGERATLDLYGDGLLEVSVEGEMADTLIQNSGVINAESGTVSLTASAAKDVVDDIINTDGIIRVSSVRQEGGKIILSGGDEGRVNVSGELDASSTVAQGGDVEVTGQYVVAEGALIDASGALGGGDINFGGEFQGGGDTPTSDFTYVDAASVLRADALEDGDGGQVVVWSDGATIFEGSISSLGAGTGAGGLVETSSLDILQATGSVAAGEWLLDPRNLTVVESSFFQNGININGFDPRVVTPRNSFTSAVSDNTIEASLNNGTSVTLQTTGGGFAEGDVFINAAIQKTRGGNATFRVLAHDDIIVARDITASRGELDVELVAGAFGDFTNNTASVQLNSGVRVRTNGGDFTATGENINLFGSIQTNGGDIDLVASLFDVDVDDTFFTNSSLFSSGGTITVDAARRFDSRSGTVVNAADGTLNITAGDIDHDGSIMAGTVNINRQTEGTISVGSNVTGSLNVSNSELSRISAGVVNFGVDGDDNNVAAITSGGVTRNSGQVNFTTQEDGSVTFSNASNFANLDVDTDTVTVNQSATVTASNTLNVDADTANLDGNLSATTLTGSVDVVNVIGSNGGAQIQDALDIAASGATVNVGAGTFLESLFIEKSVTLQGNNDGVSGDDSERLANGANETVIQPNSPAFVVNADNITIDGFVIQGDGSDVGVLVGDQGGITISNNIFRDTTDAIVAVLDSDFGTFRADNNLFESSNENAIVLNGDNADVNDGVSLIGVQIDIFDNVIDGVSDFGIVFSQVGDADNAISNSLESNVVTTQIDISNNEITSADSAISFSGTVGDAVVRIDGNIIDATGNTANGIEFVGDIVDAVIVIGGTSEGDANNIAAGLNGVSTSGIEDSSFVILNNASIVANDARSGDGIKVNGEVEDSTIVIAGNDDITGESDAIDFGNNAEISDSRVFIAGNTLTGTRQNGIRFGDRISDGSNVIIGDVTLLFSTGIQRFAGNTITGNRDGILLTSSVRDSETNFTVRGNTITGGQDGLDIQGVNGATFNIVDNTSITGTSGTAIEFEGRIVNEATVLVDNNSSITGGENGIVVGADRTGIVDSSVTFSNNTITGTPNGIVAQNSSDDLSVDSNTITGATTAIRISDSDDVDVEDNIIEGAIEGIVVSNSDDADIEDNEINQGFRTGSSTVAISITGGEDVDVIGNEIDDTTQTAILVASSEGIDIVDNTITDSVNGVSVTSSDDADIFANEILRSTGTGIAVTTSDNVEVFANTVDASFFNRGSTGISFDRVTNSEIGGSSTITVDGVRISKRNTIDDYNVGINVIGGDDIEIDNNLVTDVQTGIQASTVTQLVIEDNIVDGSTGLDLGTVGIDVTNSNGAVIGGRGDTNTVTQFVTGVDVSSSTDAEISFNDISSVNTAIDLNSGSNGSDIFLNNTNLVSGTGISISDVDNVDILQNTLLSSGNAFVPGFGTTGISISNSTNIDAGDTLIGEEGNQISLGNRIDDFTTGVFVTGGSTVEVDHNNITDAEFGIDAQGVGTLSIEDNTIDGRLNRGGAGQFGIRVTDSAGARIGGELSDQNTVRDFATGVSVSGSEGLVVSFTDIDEVTAGITITSSADSFVDDNIVVGAVTSAITLDAANAASVSGNTIDGGATGIAITGSTGALQVIGNNIDNVVTGISVDGANDVLIQGNNVPLANASLDEEESVILETGIVVTNSSNIEVDANTVSEASEFGIFVDLSSSIDVTGNTLAGNNVGIGFLDVTDSTISGNTISDSGTTGINLDTVDGIDVNGNVVTGSGQFGLLASGENIVNVALSGNTFEDNAIGARFESGVVDLTGDTNSFIGGTTALQFVPTELEGGVFADLSLVGDTIGTSFFSGQDTFFVELGNGALFAPGSPTIINALEATFDTPFGLINPVNTGFPLGADESNFLETRFFHNVDDDTLGLFFYGQPDLTEEDFLNSFGGFFVDAANVNVTVSGLPNVDVAQSLAALSTAAGGELTPEQLANLDTAAGDEGLTAEELANIETAAGDEEVHCWGDAVSVAETGGSVSFNFGTDSLASFGNNAGTGACQSSF